MVASRLLPSLACAAGLLASAPAHAGQDVGAAARSVLEARCAPCHAPASEDARARRGLEDALDLAALRAEWITAGDLEGSELWLVLSDPFDPMPPPDAESGPLSPAERFVLREWIARGGPDPAGEPPPETPARARSRSSAALARLHPVSVHFPIALLMAAALAELLAGAGGRDGLRAARRFLVQLGALGAVLSAALGWLAAEGVRASTTLEIHRWLGISTAVLGLGALFLSERSARRARASRRSLLITLVACALVAGAAGWFGGVLVWG